MSQSIRLRGMTFFILPIAIIVCGACGKPDARANAADPNAPAVVKAPPPLLPADTAKKPPPPPLIPDDEVRTKLSTLYALAGAGLSFVDPRLITAAYAPEAQLTTPNGTFTGTQAILKEYRSFAMDGSVKDFQRQSARAKIVDSTVVDTGAYAVTRQHGGATTTEVGAYAAEWRIHAPPMEWVMTKDHLYPAKKKASK
jgi:hypothetical protein